MALAFIDIWLWLVSVLALAVVALLLRPGSGHQVVVLSPAVFSCYFNACTFAHDAWNFTVLSVCRDFLSLSGLPIR